MSDYIPFHIQEEIMQRLPVKSLVRFRCVSKAWKSLIDSSQFIAAHSLYRHRQPHHLLVGFEYPEEELNYSSFVDDETLYQQRPVPAFPLSVNRLHLSTIAGVSHGLVCLDGSDPDMIAVVWNPSIRKSIAVVVPGKHFIGFGVCPVTTDPKIVAIRQSWNKSNIETTYKCQVLVYRLSSGIWRRLLTNLPTVPIDDWPVVAADGFIYWHVSLPDRNMIMSFDVTNESFELIDLPDTLARHDLGYLFVSKLKESLAILQSHRNTCTVWIMEDGVQRSFTKLFTVQAPTYALMGFRKSGVPTVDGSHDGSFKLVVYEPTSEPNNCLEVSVNPLFFNVKSYMETLLLLGQPDCISY